VQFGYGEELQGITPDEVWSKVVQKLREVSSPHCPPALTARNAIDGAHHR